MKRRAFGVALLTSVALVALGPMAGVGRADMASQQFTVRIDNVSNENTLKPSNGAKAPAAVAPGLWIIHRTEDPLFTPKRPDRGKGLEALAEDGNPVVLAETVRTDSDILSSGIFNVPIGAAGPEPIGPGGAFEFTVSAAPGARLSFAMMFGQSNDLFYAPGPKGIALFDTNGRPISADLTSSVILWDAGTEVNEEPGVGPNQAPRQPAPHMGPRENGVVRPIAEVKDGFHYPSVSEVIRVTITPQLQMAR
jgi:hypothetical protein